MARFHWLDWHSSVSEWGQPRSSGCVPAGFVQETVATGISNPTAMEFAPDGRLFVCQQGGALRVVKNGALLATPFVSLYRRLGRRARAARRRVRPELRDATASSTSTTPCRRGVAVHNRVSRFTANGDVARRRQREPILLDLDNLTSATNHNGGAHPLRPRRQALRRRRRQRQRRQRADAEQPARQDAAHQRRRLDSRPTTRSSTRRRGDNRAIWALGLRNPFTFAFQPGRPAACSSTTSARARGRRSTTASPARTTAGRRPKATSTPTGGNAGYTAPAVRLPHSGATTTGCAITGGAFYNPASPQFPAQYVGDVLLRRLLQRLDPPVRSGDGTGFGLRHGHFEPRGREGWARQRPVLPGSRRWRPGRPHSLRRLKAALVQRARLSSASPSSAAAAVWQSVAPPPAAPARCPSHGYRRGRGCDRVARCAGLLVALTLLEQHHLHERIHVRLADDWIFGVHVGIEQLDQRKHGGARVDSLGNDSRMQASRSSSFASVSRSAYMLSIESRIGSERLPWLGGSRSSTIKR